MVSPQGFLIPSILKVSQFWAPGGCSIIPLQKPPCSGLHFLLYSSLTHITNLRVLWGQRQHHSALGCWWTVHWQGSEDKKKHSSFFTIIKRNEKKQSIYIYFCVQDLVCTELTKTAFIHIFLFLHMNFLFKCAPLLPLNIMVSFSLLLFYIIIYMPRYII